jgi:hypothetical protein
MQKQDTQGRDTQPQAKKGPDWKLIARSQVPSLLVNAVLPLIIYTLLKDYAHVSEFIALVATGIPSLIDSCIGIIRNRRIDFIAGVVLFGIAISLGLTALGGSPKLLLVRESFFTFAFGLACLISLPFPKPICFYTGRQFMAANDPVRIARYDSMWQFATFRTAIRMLTVIWGVGLVIEAIVRTYLVFTMSVETFLAVSPIILYGILALTFVVGTMYMRRWRKKTGDLPGLGQRQA